MNGRCFIDLGMPALLAFRGPDAERYLNGQLTQDVRRLAAGDICLPACVTDAKGRMQFRVWLARGPEGGLWVQDAAGRAEELEARLTRYLIADDVEVEALTGNRRLLHFPGEAPEAPEGVVVRSCRRFGGEGADWWVPAGFSPPDGWELLDGAELEDFRIRRGVPAWGRELSGGLLPPEAGLEETDISYQKGCYIGQEVISRMKRAGRTNKRLIRLVMDGPVAPGGSSLVTAEGAAAGELTSVSPIAAADGFHALGFVKRGTTEWFAATPDGRMQPVREV